MLENHQFIQIESWCMTRHPLSILPTMGDFMNAWNHAVHLPGTIQQEQNNSTECGLAIKRSKWGTCYSSTCINHWRGLLQMAGIFDLHWLNHPTVVEWWTLKLNTTVVAAVWCITIAPSIEDRCHLMSPILASGFFLLSLDDCASTRHEPLRLTRTYDLALVLAGE